MATFAVRRLLQLAPIIFISAGCKPFQVTVPPVEETAPRPSEEVPQGQPRPETCDLPRIVDLQANLATTKVIVTWTYDGALSSGSVIVERKLKAEQNFGALKKLSMSSASHYSDDTTQAGMSYTYRLKLQRAALDGCESVSNAVDLVRPGAILPPPPTTVPMPTTTTIPTTTTTQPVVIIPPPEPGPIVAGAPAIHFVDLESGPLNGGPGNLGAPISIFGAGFGQKGADSKVLIGGQEVSSYLVWAPAGSSMGAYNSTLDLIIVQPPRNISSGNIQVIVNGKASAMGPMFRANQGKILYISRSGSDSAACTEAAPCATMSATFGKLAAGDLILMRGGDYSESEIWIRREYNHSGTAMERKTLKAYPGENVSLSNAQRNLIVDADYVTISSLRFLNGKATGVSEKESLENSRVGNKFINNSFEGVISWSAIDTHGNDHVLAGNSCRVTGSVVGTQGHCYYISYGNNIKLQYNIGSGAPGYGIHIFDQRRRASGDFPRVLSNILVEGNILTNSTQRSGLILACADEAGLGNRVENVIVRNNILAGNAHIGMAIPPYCLVRNIKVYNNTFYENGRQAIALGGTNLNQNIDIANNLFHQTENTVCKLNCQWYLTAHFSVEKPATNLTLRNNGYSGLAPTILGAADGMMRAGMAMFTDPARLDLRLLPGSVGLGMGLLLPEAPLDYFGTHRRIDDRTDLGAFER